MVSLRCKLAVKAELEKLGLHCSNVDLGVAEISEEITPQIKETLRKNLSEMGLELYENKKSILVEQIKKEILEMIFGSTEMPKINYSDYLSEKLNSDYTYLANVFSELNGITIQHFVVLNKVERVKELLLQDNLSLSEISFKLNYSSVAHLSNQFKKHTGMTPSCYKQMVAEKNNDHERICL